MEDDSILLVRDGQVVWSLEEALTNIVQTNFFNLPLQLIGEKNRAQAQAMARDINTVTLSERLSSQVEQVSSKISSFAEFFSKVIYWHCTPEISILVLSARVYMYVCMYVYYAGGVMAAVFLFVVCCC